MVSKLNYDTIKNMRPMDAMHYLQSIEKGLVKDVTVLDLLNADTLQKPFAETYFIDLYPRGIYLFFDQSDCIKYVGKTHQGFYNRLMTQLDTTFYEGFGWNALFRILGGNRTGKAHDDLCEEDHEVEYDEVINYKLILIDTHRDISSYQLGVLEKIIMKAFRAQEKNTLVNTRIGWLTEDQYTQTIKELING